jgi:SNF2 family DNA or RNA helicase
MGVCPLIADKLFKPHQETGVEWMLSRETQEDCKGGLLADEVGLGKTVMAIATICSNSRMNTLVIVPKSLINQWEEQFKIFSPHINVVKPVNDHVILNTNEKVIGVTLISHSRLNKQNTSADSSPYTLVSWDRIVIDEAHVIKNKRAKIHKVACELQSDIKWALTATPVMNKMTDFISIMEWIGVPQEDCQADKRNVVNTYLLRRTKDEIKEINPKFDLPPLNVQVKKTSFNHEEESLYDAVYKSMKTKYVALQQTGQEHSFEVLELIMRIRQVCISPLTFVEGMIKKCKRDPTIENHFIKSWTGPTSKSEQIVSDIRKQSENDKGLLYCHFTREIQIYLDMLKKIGIKALKLDGSMDIDERTKSIKMFTDDTSIKILIVQIQTGGVGYNFQMANHIYITSPTWNPALQYQVIGRCHRSGQTKPVHVSVYVVESKVVTQPYIEQQMLDIQASKEEIITETLNGDSTSSTSEVKIVFGI